MMGDGGRSLRGGSFRVLKAGALGVLKGEKEARD
jgi:hypothetical protein